MSAKNDGRRLNTYKHLKNYRVDKDRSWPYALRIHCSGCPTEETVQLPRGYIYTCLQSIADGAFKKKGWEIGRNRKHDLCPACVAKEHSQRAIAAAQRQANINRDDQEARARLNELEAERRRQVAADRAKELRQPSGFHVATPAAAPPDVDFVMEQRARPEPPRLTAHQAQVERKMDAMPPLQAGLILARMRQVFRENKTGYIDGWHDDRLAKELRVSALWIIKVRTDNFPNSHSYDPGAGRALFGPAVANVNADAQRLFDEIEAGLAEARHAEARLLAMAAAWRDKRVDLEGRAAQIESRLYALEDRAKELADLGASKPIVPTPDEKILADAADIRHSRTNFPTPDVADFRHAVSETSDTPATAAAIAKAAAARGCYGFRKHPLFREGAKIIGRKARGTVTDAELAHGKALQRQAFDEFKSGAWKPPSD